MTSGLSATAGSARLKLLRLVVRRIVPALLLLLLPAPCLAWKSIALHYGPNPPITELRAFDLVVIDPDHPSIQGVPHATLGGSCLRERRRDRPSAFSNPGVPSSWSIGVNPAWKTQVADQSNPQWRKFLVETIIVPLWERGYRGSSSTPSTPTASRLPRPLGDQTAGLVALIREIRARCPDAKLILNRGFELLPETAGIVDAVAAESLFRRWDPVARAYGEVPEADRNWLCGGTREGARPGNPAIAIDYVPPGDRALTRETARRIADLGIIPGGGPPARNPGRRRRRGPSPDCPRPLRRHRGG